MKYRKKPIVVEAIFASILISNARWNWSALPLWIQAAYEQGRLVFTDHAIYINTLEGNLTASADDYIIRGIHGEIYPCKPDIFEATYELVTENGMMMTHFQPPSIGRIVQFSANEIFPAIIVSVYEVQFPDENITVVDLLVFKSNGIEPVSCVAHISAARSVWWDWLPYVPPIKIPD